MTMPPDVAARRFHLLAAIRLVGLALMIAGLFVAFTDLARPGGDAVLGGVLALSGALDAFYLPRQMRRKWRAEDKA